MFTIRSSQCSWQDQWASAVDFLPCRATLLQRKHLWHNNPTRSQAISEKAGHCSPSPLNSCTLSCLDQTYLQ